LPPQPSDINLVGEFGMRFGDATIHPSFAARVAAVDICADSDPR
jgi:hypothetical protein